jgi:hypothetical protein
MKGKRTIWINVRSLEIERPTAGWTGPLPIVCPQQWPAADGAAWDAAEATGDKDTLEALVERHAGVHPLPPESGIRCIVIRHQPPHGDEA